MCVCMYVVYMCFHVWCACEWLWVCMSAYVWVHMCVCRRRLETGVSAFLDCTLWGLSLEPELPDSASLASQLASEVTCCLLLNSVTLSGLPGPAPRWESAVELAPMVWA